jgi:predicted ester cyclase
MGIAPTGKDAVVSGITLSRVADGKIAEEWTNWDTLGMLQQIGAVPAPATTQMS